MTLNNLTMNTYQLNLKGTWVFIFIVSIFHCIHICRWVALYSQICLFPQASVMPQQNLELNEATWYKLTKLTNFLGRYIQPNYFALISSMITFFFVFKFCLQLW